jgi:hypothetical protein
MNLEQYDRAVVSGDPSPILESAMSLLRDSDNEDRQDVLAREADLSSLGFSFACTELIHSNYRMSPDATNYLMCCLEAAYLMGRNDEFAEAHKTENKNA